MAKKYLDYDGLSHFWLQIKSLFVADIAYDSTNKKITKTKAGSTSDVVSVETLKTDLNISVPTAATSNPLMDGTAAVGSSSKYAKEDHVHPKDTSKVSTSREINGHPLSSDVTIANLDLGQGYGTCGTAQAVTEKAVTLSNYIQSEGGIVVVKFTYGVPASSTLKVGGYAARDIYYKGAAITGGIITAGDTVTFMYSNAKYHVVAIDKNLNAPDITFDATNQKVQFQFSVLSPKCYTDSQVDTLLGGKVNSSLVGAASGICPLNASSKIDSTYLPSYVDDVVEAYARSGQTALSQNWLSATSGGSALTPETGKIYILMADSSPYSANDTFRWSGSTYVKLADGGVSAITNSEIDTILAS